MKISSLRFIFAVTNHHLSASLPSLKTTHPCPLQASVLPISLPGNQVSPTMCTPSHLVPPCIPACFPPANLVASQPMGSPTVYHIPTHQVTRLRTISSTVSSFPCPSAHLDSCRLARLPAPTRPAFPASTCPSIHYSLPVSLPFTLLSIYPVC